MDEASSLIEEVEKFSLTTEEENVVIDNIPSHNTPNDLQFCLIGKLLTSRLLTTDILQNSLRNSWNLEDKDKFKVHNLGSNIYIFEFHSLVEKNRILLTGPWSFDKGLIVLEHAHPLIKPSDMDFKKVGFWIHFLDLPIAYRNKEMATILGNSIGEFLDIDCDSLDRSWQPSLRVRVLYDISKPLRRVIKVHTENCTNGSQIHIRYEKLPDFCYFCGLIGHVIKDCNVTYAGCSSSILKKVNYGPWLRYQALPRSPIQRKSGPDGFSLYREAQRSTFHNQ